MDDLAAWALDAIDDDERAAIDALVETEPAIAMKAARFEHAAAALALLVGDDLAPSPRGRQRLLGIASRRRPPVDEVITEQECLRRAVDTLDQLLTELAPAQWHLPVVVYGSVQAMVAHLCAVEHYVGAQLGLWPSELVGFDHSHVAMSQPSINKWADASPDAVVDEWRRLTRAVADAVAADPGVLGQPASWHGAQVDVRALLVIRTFELWTHADDVRRAIGQPIESPDAGQLRHMTELAVAILPTAMGLVGVARPGRTARIVLTGPGKGVWLQSLAPGEVLLDTEVVRDLDTSSPRPRRAPDVEVTIDAVSFCRVAARRLTPAELDLGVVGDGALVADLFAGLVALATD